MKITAIEIRQHTFERGMRGYKPEDVDAFLISLSQEWERLTGDFKMLKMQLELAEKELGKLREVEMTLFRTLKMAEDTSTQITDQATKAADQHLTEARQKADELLADARKRSALMVQDAENQARFLKDNILNDLKTLEHDFKALENYKENLSVQIRTLAGNALDSVDRFEKRFAKQNLKGKLDEVTGQLQATAEPQNEAVEQPAAEAPTPAEELPPLAERQNAVPEAIPVDQPVVDQLNEAIDATQHEDDKPEEHPQPVDDEVATPTPEASQPEPAPVHSEQPAEETRLKKSGSFFDQI